MQNLRTVINNKPSSHFGSFSNKCTKSKKLPLKSDTITYLFAFNGKEKLDEINGAGNDLDFGARIYDARLGRFATIDLFSWKFPAESHYAFAGNSPICFIDFNGLYKIDPSQLKTWQDNYPLLLCYLQNDFANDLNRDKELMKNLSEECKISFEQLNEILSKDGPNVSLNDLSNGAVGYTGSKYGISLDNYYLTNIEMTLKNPNATFIEKQAAILTFYITMVHETVHVGYYTNNPFSFGTDNTLDEVGDRFIMKNFGFNPSDARKIMKLPEPINNTYTYINEAKLISEINYKCNKAARCSLSEGYLNTNKVEKPGDEERTMRNLPTIPSKK
jgi:RHS repeat-associated protein